MIVLPKWFQIKVKHVNIEIGISKIHLLFIFLYVMFESLYMNTLFIIEIDILERGRNAFVTPL